MPKYIQQTDLMQQPLTPQSGIAKATHTLKESDQLIDKIDSIATKVLKMVEVFQSIKKNNSPVVGGEGVKAEQAFNEGQVFGRETAARSIAPQETQAPQVLYKRPTINIRSDLIFDSLYEMLKGMNQEQTVKDIVEKMAQLKENNSHHALVKQFVEERIEVGYD